MRPFANLVDTLRTGAARSTIASDGGVVGNRGIDDVQAAGCQINAAALGVASVAAISAGVSISARGAAGPCCSQETRSPTGLIALHRHVAQRHLAAVDEHAAALGRATTADRALNPAVFDREVLQYHCQARAGGGDDVQDAAVPGAVQKRAALAGALDRQRFVCPGSVLIRYRQAADLVVPGCQDNGVARIAVEVGLPHVEEQFRCVCRRKDGQQPPLLKRFQPQRPGTLVRCAALTLSGSLHGISPLSG
jgi:hypothetical protein